MTGTWSVLCLIGAIAGAGWGTHAYMGSYQPKADATAQHQKIEEDVVVMSAKQQMLLDAQYESLVATIARLEAIQRVRPLNGEEQANLEYARKQLEVNKKLRQVK